MAQQQPPGGVRGNGSLDGLEDLEEVLRDGLDEARELASEADRRLRDLVVEHPLLALGGAVVAGYALGRLLRRR
jgi:ElaB/YqjD/DUF883 family membrane-anchored ribosome-binding protein